MGQPWPLFYFPSLSQYNEKSSTKFDNKSIDGVFGNRTWDSWMVGADESTVLVRSPYVIWHV